MQTIQEDIDAIVPYSMHVRTLRLLIPCLRARHYMTDAGRV